MSEGVSFEARVVLRPRSIDEVLDLALAYTRIYRRDLLRVALFLVVPALALIVGLHRWLELDWWRTWAVALAC